MKKRARLRRLTLSKETLRHLTDPTLSEVVGGEVTRAFTGCEYCSLAGGTACDPDHTNFSKIAGCTRQNPV